MEDTQVSAFGGVMGRVLRDSMSVATVVTGVVLGLVFLASGFILGLVGAKGLAMVLGQIVVAVALARFALNGMAGDSSGTIFSTAGGSWPTAMMVAGRYLFLNLLWIAPLLLVGWSLVGSAAGAALLGGGAAAAPGHAGASGGAVAPGGAAMPGGAGGLPVMLPILAVLTSKAFIASAIIFLLGTAILPPIFLIVAVRAERFGQVFSTVLWSNTFSGRLGDLYAIYVVHGGALGMLFILAIPALLLTFAAGKEIGIFFIAFSLAYGGGLAITLLGRLCGFFALGEDLAGPAPSTQWAGDLARGVAKGPGGRARPPEIFGSPETASDPGIPAGGHVRSGVSRGVGSGAATRSIAAAGAVETGASRGAGAAGEAAAGTVAVSRKAPPLPDLSRQIEEVRRRFESDGEEAVEQILELRAQNPAHPQVLHAAVLLLEKAGRTAEAVLVAREAVPLCLERGHAVLAAELFAALWKQTKELGLGHEQIDAVAATLAKAGDHNRAITAYGIALQVEHGDRKAIKGLLQLADHKVHREGRPKDAVRIYTFLLQFASDTPFAEDIRLRLADAESRLARAA